MGLALPVLKNPALAEEKKNKPAVCGLVSDARFKRHLTGRGHADSPDRFDAVHAALEKAGFSAQLKKIESREATQEEILRVHTRKYYDIVKSDFEAGKRRLSTGDTAISADSLMVASLASGSALNATDAVCTGTLKRVFCNLRPPGHHASPSRGMGFCIWNHVALVARHAQQVHKIGRVLIVDWDVHHGNGTQDAFYEDDTVFVFNTHQAPWYPGTGHSSETGLGKGKGFTMNCPLPAGSGRKEILGAMENKLIPAMKSFRPELVLISAGFDSRKDDPLGGFLLEDQDFADMTELLAKVAADSAEGRMISLLEGGYHLSGLASACTAHVQALVDA
ncbi:MAG: histone deacetylase [Terrimicrobiaceae bacterium]